MNDRTNIELLFRRHYVTLHRMAMALLHDADIARDIVHDLFASLLNGTVSTDVNESYLIRAVKNRCLNHLRDYDSHRRIQNLYMLENMDYESEDWPDEETIARIHEVIESELSPQTRRVMSLRFSDGKKFALIAQEMGISENAVYRHMRHAITVIRKKLNDNG